MSPLLRFAILLTAANWIHFSWAGTDCSEYVVQPIDKLPAPYLVGLNTTFYKKFASANGIPVMSSDNVTDYALKESARIIQGVTRNLQPGFLDALIARTERISMWGSGETACSIPEVARPCFLQHFSGGMAFDNILILQETSFECDDRGNAWIGRVLIHEFGHSINFVFDDVQPGLQKQLDDAYANAQANQIWPPDEYAMTDDYEYFAVGEQTWFEANEVRHCEMGFCNKSQLQENDPELYAVEAQALTGPDWLYKCDEFCDPDSKSEPAKKRSVAEIRQLRPRFLKVKPGFRKYGYFGRKQKKVIRDDYSKLHG